ncbi:hypothetical protein [Actinomadura monticuli]|uniref:Uncharacterized protein n=1 Tax=Actinomadura monticuli TaxID=3097367 RepID=A0ABV4QIK3_9ACTN
MRLSSSLPPAGFTRAEPSPPTRRRALRAPWPLLAAVVVLVLGAGLIAAAYGELRTASRSVTPDAATQPPPAKRPAPPAERPEPVDAVTAAPSPEPARHRGRPAPRSSRRTPAASRRPAVPDRPRARPTVKRKTRAARPAPPSWIDAECRRRFPDDPLRRRYCAAAYVRGWEAMRG